MRLLAAVALCAAIHILFIAGAGLASGIVVRSVGFGFGPTVLQWRVFRLSLLPLGGHVRFMDSREEPVAAHDMGRALDGKSSAVQLFVTLSGCMVLVGAACALIGDEALQVLVQFPGMFVKGALSPWGEGTALLTRMDSYLDTTSFLPLLGTTAASLAAVNLLPLPMMNGGAAIAIVARHLGLAKRWPAFATQVLSWLYLGLLAGWLTAWLVPKP